ncbi:MAG: MazG-like family protein [Anaerotignum sp.]|nr:MazG-like family protein [Anaerotignum sp.]
MEGKDFDIAKNIKMTENLQCQMLSAVSQFFTAMQENAAKAEKAEILAELEIVMYLLAARMGISKETLDQKAVAKLKLGLLQEERPEWKTSLLELHRELGLKM